LVLEVVVLLGTAAADESCAMLLCKADILLSLIELLKGKQASASHVTSGIVKFSEVLVVNMALTFYLSFLPFIMWKYLQ
jgi:hypothetical protein